MVNLAETNKPDWSAIKDRLTHKKIEVEREYIKLKTKIKNAEADGRIERKIQEIIEFWNNSSRFYDMCIDALMDLSNDYLFCSKVPEGTPFTKMDFFDELSIMATKFESYECPDNVKKGVIYIKPLGQIVFLLEDDPKNYVSEYNVIVSRYGLNDKLWERTRSKRIRDEKIYLTINNSNWPPNLLTYDFVERFLASSIIHLIDTIPLYSDSDFKI